MTPPPPADFEAARLAALKRYEVLDTPEEAEFDDFTRLAAQVCLAPIALISLVAGDRQWFKAKFGMDAREIPLEVSICKHALNHQGVFIVPDTTLDPRFLANPLVSGAPHVRFYAGAPLVSSDGLPLGTLCVLDFQPRELTEAQELALTLLARQVMNVLELRLSQRRLHNTIETMSDAVMTLDHDYRFTYLNSHAVRLLGRPRDAYLGNVMWEVCELGYEGPFASKFRQAVAENRLVQFEQYYAGSALWLDVRACPSPEGLTVYFQDVTTRRAKEEQLRLLENCVSRLNDIVLITDAEPVDEPGPRILYVNDAFVQRTGYSREEVVGRSPRFLQGPKTQRDALDRIRESLKKWQPVREELINYTKSGEEFWLELDIVPVADASGWYTHWVAIERDVTTRKCVEVEQLQGHVQFARQHNALVALTHSVLRRSGDEGAVLREICETVSAALEAGRVSLWSYNVDRTTILCRNLFESGVNRHSAGMTLNEESFPCYFKALEENDVIPAHDARRDERTREFAVSYLEPLGISSMLDAPVLVGGELGGVLCIEHVGPQRQWTHAEQSFAVSVTNLVSLLLSQRAQARSEARLRTIFESEPECVKIVSPDGLLQNVNPAGLLMLEAENLKQVQGAPVIALVHPEDQAAFQGLHQGACEGKTGQMEFRMTGLKGTTRWMETHSTPLREPDGTITSVVSVTRDVTERKMAALRLARLNRLYQMLSRTNEAIVRIKGRLELFEAVCHIAVEYGLFRTAAMVRVDEESGRVFPLAQAGAENGYFSEISVILSDPELSQGTIGTALRTGHYDVCNDFGSDPRMAAWKDSALRRGYRSTASFPIRAEDGIVAVLVLFAGEVDYFKEDEVDLLVAVAEDVSFAIESLNREGQRLLMEEALRLSEASMSAAQRIGHFGSWELELADNNNVNANVLRWSDEMYRIVGYEPGEIEVTNNLFFKHAHPEDHEAIRCAVADAIRERKAYTIVHRLLRKDGEERIVHETAQIFYDDASGLPLRMVGTAHDITEQRRAEEALRESEERFRGTFEQAAVGMAHVSSAGRFLRVNHKLCDILGFERDELLELSFADLTVREDLAGSDAARHAMLAAEMSSFTLEKRYLRKDGEQVWINLMTTLERTSKGEPKYFISVFEDITERKRAEAQLREQATLLDKAQDAILVRDLDHHILYWNQSAERLFGWKSTEALGRSAEELLCRDPAEFFASTAVTLEKGEWVGELEQSTKDGQSLIVEARWTLVRDDQGKPKSILAISTDITGRKQMEQQFFRAQRMESIGTLAGGIAHDLNNVLAPILMSIDLLRLGESNPQRKNILATIERSAKRGADMVKQVLSFAKGVSGQQVDVNVGALIGEIEKITNETFLKNIQVRAEVPPGIWAVKGDPTQLHQVLLNLCVNARDAMPTGGKLFIGASNKVLDDHYAAMNMEARPGPHVIIQVEDSGMGMPPDVIDRIFEPFFTTKELGKGTGLGLSTTIAIVKSHGGFIRVYSELGVGTKFCVYLPALTVTAAEPLTLIDSDLPRGSGELILVVDDEAAVRNITQQTLEAFGYRVLVAADGTEATALYAR